MSADIKPLVSPWVPEGDPRKLKVLGKAAEEAGEYSQALARCIIQGLGESEPVTGKPNKRMIEEEMADVYATLYLVAKEFKLDGHFIEDRMHKKIGQLRSWFEMGSQ